MEKLPKEQLFTHHEKSEEYALQQKIIAEGISGQQNPSSEFYDLAEELLSSERPGVASTLERIKDRLPENTNISPVEIVEKSGAKISKEVAIDFLLKNETEHEIPNDIKEKYPEIYKVDEQLAQPSHKEIESIFRDTVEKRTGKRLKKELGENLLSAREVSDAVGNFVKNKVGVFDDIYGYILSYCRENGVERIYLGRDISTKREIWTNALKRDDLAKIFEGYVAAKKNSELKNILDQAQVDLGEFKSKKIRPLERHAEKIVMEYNTNEIKKLLKKPNLIWIDWNYGASHVEHREYSGWDDYYGEIFHGSTSQGYDNFLTKTGIFYGKHNKLYEAEKIDERNSSYYSETDANHTTSHNTKELDKSPDEIISNAVRLAQEQNLNFLGIRVNGSKIISAEELKNYKKV